MSWSDERANRRKEVWREDKTRSNSRNVVVKAIIAYDVITGGSLIH